MNILMFYWLLDDVHVHVSIHVEPLKMVEVNNAATSNVGQYHMSPVATRVLKYDLLFCVKKKIQYIF